MYVDCTTRYLGGITAESLQDLLLFFFHPRGVKTQLLTVLPRCEAQQHVAQGDEARRLQVGSGKAVGACSAPSGSQPTCGTWRCPAAPPATYTKPNRPQPRGDSPLQLNFLLWSPGIERPQPRVRCTLIFDVALCACKH